MGPNFLPDRSCLQLILTWGPQIIAAITANVNVTSSVRKKFGRLVVKKYSQMYIISQTSLVRQWSLQPQALKVISAELMIKVW